MRAAISRLLVLSLSTLSSIWFSGCSEDVEPSTTGGSQADAQDDSADGGAPADATNGDSCKDADAGPQCQEEQVALIAFVKSSQACTHDADCVFVYSRSNIREHCSGGFYLNGGYDKPTYQSLEQAVENCLGPDSWFCAEYPDPPACWNGRCVNGGGGMLDVYDQCVASMGGVSACTLRFCPDCGGCDGIAGCYPLYTCARAAGCLGKPCGDASDPNFSCGDELAAAGGIESPDYERYRFISGCVANWQSATECATP